MDFIYHHRENKFPDKNNEVRTDWHLLPIHEIQTLLDTTASGLSHFTASDRLTTLGKNQIEDIKKKSIFQMLLNQFSDFMILILLAAAVISGLIGDIIDTVIIITIVILNAVVGFVQEYRAEKTIEALKILAETHSRILREGTMKDIPSSDLVVGDVIMLKTGNIIPADIRFFETHQLKIDESTLTGESINVDKNSKKLENGNYLIGDRSNMGYRGTSVTKGRALAIVISTGMETELGHIAKMIQSTETLTPLQKRLNAFGKRLSVLIIFICTVIFVIGWLRGEQILNMLLTSISLAVAAVPEALPALVTIALAIGAKRLVKNNVLIRKLPAVETLGSVTYICSDKTGTLTTNKMTVNEVIPVSETNIDFATNIDNALLIAMALNNDATRKTETQWVGESTEIALAKYAYKNNFNKLDLETKYPRIAELAFDSSRKCMTTFHQAADYVISITKGAVDVLLDKLDTNQKLLVSDFQLKGDTMAKKGNRVLGYAIKTFKVLPAILDADEIETDLTLIGLVGLIDPPRAEVKLAVTQCKEAGIIPVMITGDHPLTAIAISKTLGIISSDQDLVLTGQELTKLKQSDLEKLVEHIRVYARVNPEQKLKIIKALQDKNHIVAMTGDGVNDAPALKKSDIGIAMGINGTEVTKEASHMILLDDDFSTIVKAVKHGRRIFDNILKFIKYTMTSNSGEIWVIFLAPFFGLPVPLIAVHILWINLVTDGLPGLALASEPFEDNIMSRPPRHPKQNIFSGGMGIHILWVGFLMGITTLAMQAWAIESHNPNWQTMAFTVLCFSQMGHVMSIRSGNDSIFKTGVFTNKPLLGALSLTIVLQLMIIYVPFFNEIFRTHPLSIFEITITLIVSSIVFWAVEIEKWIKRRRK